MCVFHFSPSVAMESSACQGVTLDFFTKSWYSHNPPTVSTYNTIHNQTKLIPFIYLNNVLIYEEISLLWFDSGSFGLKTPWNGLMVCCHLYYNQTTHHIEKPFSWQFGCNQWRQFQNESVLTTCFVTTWCFGKENWRTIIWHYWKKVVYII